MHLSSGLDIPDGLLAANALLAENSRLGVPASTHTLHPGFGFVISNTALGLRRSLYDDGVGSRCTGKERDTESGLDYFGARYYASTMGRWMSPDWADKPEAVPYSSLDNPQSLNLYGYVLNNPLRNEDADGHACCDAVKRFASGVVDTTVAPIGQMIRHPGDAVTGLGMAVVHPLNTLGAIKDAAVSTGEAALSGDAYAIGEVVGTAAASLSGAEEVEVAGDVAKVGEAAEATSKVFSVEKQALVDMAKTDKKLGMTSADMQAYKDLNKTLPDPFPANKVRGPEAHSSGLPSSQQPHGHVGPVDHIPIKDKTP